MSLRVILNNRFLKRGIPFVRYSAENHVQTFTTSDTDNVFESKNRVRVRFAPSPTGQIHLGGLRTALFNYLFAKSHDGKFLLRIEDTDQERLVQGATEKLVDMLEWSGIVIDEGPFHGGNRGPYVQSQRLHLYLEHIQTLLQNGTAYRCFCTPERLELLKKQQLSRRETPKYDNRCRHFTSDEVAEKLSRNEPHIVRFKLESCNKPWRDLVYGRIQSDVAAIEGDPVLMKSDGFPTYHFANVVDDHLMDVTHVLRGLEWQVSTKKHILLYEAFGWKPPSFGHLPLLVNKNGKKLSKREGDMHVESLQKKGYFPESIQNFLCFCGSGFTVPQIERKGMDLNELADCFDIKEINTRPSKLDFLHLQEINRIFIGKRLRGPQKTELIQSVRETVREHFKHSPELLQESTLQEDNIEKILKWAQTSRINLLSNLVEKDMLFLWSDTSSDSVIEEIQSVCKTHSPHSYIQSAVSLVTELEDGELTEEKLPPLLSELLKENKFPMREVMMTLRLVLCGQKKGAPVGELIAVLGKSVTLERLNLVLGRLSEDSEQINKL